MKLQIKPTWDEHGVPVCTEGECPQFDGKRCEAFGWRPERICEPAVRDMAKRLKRSPAATRTDQVANRKPSEAPVRAEEAP